MVEDGDVMPAIGVRPKALRFACPLHGLAS
jgi:hypothetical protein